MVDRMPAEENVTARRVASARLARRLVHPPGNVLLVASGPLSVLLEGRVSTLQALRAALAAEAMEPAVAIGGVWRQRVVATGDEVLRLLVEDEQAAEARCAWWTHSYVWRDPQRLTFLLYVPHEDSHDLVFLAWGASAEPWPRVASTASAPGSGISVTMVLDK
jgi:hypothetical protein